MKFRRMLKVSVVLSKKYAKDKEKIISPIRTLWKLYFLTLTNRLDSRCNYNQWNAYI